MKTIAASTLLSAHIDLNKVFTLILGNSLNLKLSYLLIEHTIAFAIQNESQLSRCQEFLKLLKDRSESDYNQSILHILKQSKESRDKILSIL